MRPFFRYFRTAGNISFRKIKMSVVFPKEDASFVSTFGKMEIRDIIVKVRVILKSDLGVNII